MKTKKYVLEEDKNTRVVLYVDNEKNMLIVSVQENIGLDGNKEWQELDNIKYIKREGD